MMVYRSFPWYFHFKADRFIVCNLFNAVCRKAVWRALLIPDSFPIPSFFPLHKFLAQNVGLTLNPWPHRFRGRHSYRLRTSFTSATNFAKLSMLFPCQPQEKEVDSAALRKEKERAESYPTGFINQREAEVEKQKQILTKTWELLTPLLDVTCIYVQSSLSLL